jgi:hypothetical protein
VHIRALGEIYHEVPQSPPELKELFMAAVGQSLRRPSRFMQLSLIGAARCAKDAVLPSHTAVYLASGRGDLEIVMDVLEQVYRDGQSPKPLSFVNTVSNSACFYIAKCLALEGRSSFVCNPYFAFENALQLALEDLRSGAISSALVGSADVIVPPLDAHRKRLEVSEQTPLGEASHWMLLQSEGDAPVRGQVLAVQHFTSRDALIGWLNESNFDPRTSMLSTGAGLQSHDLNDIRTAGGFTRTFDYRSNRAFYDTQSAAVIPAFLEEKEDAELLVHINGDPLQRYVGMVVRATARDDV